MEARAASMSAFDALVHVELETLQTLLTDDALGHRPRGLSLHVYVCEDTRHA